MGTEWMCGRYEATFGPQRTWDSVPSSLLRSWGLLYRFREACVVKRLALALEPKLQGATAANSQAVAEDPPGSDSAVPPI